MAEEGSVLIIDDKPNMLKMLKTLLGDSYEVTTADSADEGLHKFRDINPDVVLSDIRMPGMSGMELLRKMKDENPTAEVILMTAYAEVSQAVKAVKEGAYNYVTKPFEPEDIQLTLDKALERKRLREKTEILQQEIEEKYGFPNIVGDSKPMRRAFKLARKAAESDATVLLTGESGTGKEVFAKAIHYTSPRSTDRFVDINCAAVPEGLIESELFGHVKGAFSGASQEKKGLFEEADGGTLFLDEVTELPSDLQVKLNRAIQEKEIRRVGDTRNRQVDARIIASSNRELEQALEDGEIREDLYYRLNVFPIHLPPLRERDGDIPLLVRHFLQQEVGAEEAEEYDIEPDAMQMLLAHNWPGNIRELENVIERAVVLAEEKTITADILSPLSPHEAESEPRMAPLSEMTYEEAMDKMSENCRRQYLVEVLKQYGGNVTKAAEHAGIERESFHRLMRKCDIDSDEIRGRSGN